MRDKQKDTIRSRVFSVILFLIMFAVFAFSFLDGTKFFDTMNFATLSISSYPTQSVQSFNNDTTISSHTTSATSNIAEPQPNSTDSPTNYHKRLVIRNPTPLDEIIDPVIPSKQYIPNLDIQWVSYGPDHLDIVIRDADKDRFELPLEHPYPYPRHPPLSDFNNSNFEVEIEQEPFNMVIKRKSTNEIIFQLVNRFVYTDLYTEFTFQTPTNNLYGLGERSGPLQMHIGTYSLFIYDRPGDLDPGVAGHNSNGHQSMYLMAEKSKAYHVCVLRNIHAQELVIQENNTITWKVVGGVLDLNFFLGDTPEMALERYHEYIGGWVLPAFWHLGSHQSKWWGYTSLSDLEFVLQEYDRVDLPLDVLWSDIDYLVNSCVNFWFDRQRFPPKKMTELFKKYRKKWIPVVQAYVTAQHESHAWTYPGVESLFVRDGLNSTEPSVGSEFSGLVYFIDFFNPKTEAFWHKMLEHLDSLVPVDGVWLDANEVQNFYHFYKNYFPREHFEKDEKRKYRDWPFYPGGVPFYDLATVELDSLHYGDIEEFNVRPVSSVLQSIYTYRYLQKKHYFPFVLSRGNMMGTGQYAFHFIPDTHSKWGHLRAGTSITNVYNIFGIPMVGPDICGMGGDNQTEPELCARWYQVASFYPFARNHHSPQNDIMNFQEPYRYSGIYFDAIAASIRLRYSILKQFYAMFFLKKGSIRRLGTIFRPVFFEFATDPNLPEYGHKAHEDQFMLGESLMVAPAVYENVTTVEAYIPDCRWFDLRNYKEVPFRGEIANISAGLDELPPHFLRGGHLLFKQDTQGIRSTADLSNVFTLIVGLSDLQENGLVKSGEAIGHIMSATDYEEKYIYENCTLKSCMLKVKVSYEYNKETNVTTIGLKVQSVETGSALDAIFLDNIFIMGTDSGTLQNAKKVICSGCDSEQTLQLETEDEYIKVRTTFVNIVITDGAVYDFKISST